jgi:hypothetical protein
MWPSTFRLDFSGLKIPRAPGGLLFGVVPLAAASSQGLLQFIDDKDKLLEEMKDGGAPAEA